MFSISCNGRRNLLSSIAVLVGVPASFLQLATSNALEAESSRSRLEHDPLKPPLGRLRKESKPARSRREILSTYATSSPFPFAMHESSEMDEVISALVKLKHVAVKTTLDSLNSMFSQVEWKLISAARSAFVAGVRWPIEAPRARKVQRATTTEERRLVFMLVGQNEVECKLWVD